MKYVVTNDNSSNNGSGMAMGNITTYILVILLVFGCVYACHKFFGNNAKYSTMIIIAILAFYLFSDCDSY
jgi:hypothetical protein